MTQSINRIAVLGAGVMGAQIAAHCVNGGFQVDLYDLDTNMVKKALKSLLRLKPAPLACASIASHICAKNYQDDLEALTSADLIIEAIAERMDIKQSLYQKVAPYINEKAFFVTNTSGLSLESLSEVLPEALRSRFCGVHFFNPPRYMKLAELIPTKNSRPDMLDELETFLTRYLGKGVIRAKDTPNFIANRIGVFSLLATIYHAKRFDIPFDVVDALTGPLIGRPKSATFRTLDLVGLDTMAHVIDTMSNTLKDCPWHAYYQKPDWLLGLIAKGKLGQKTEGGIYQKVGRTIQVLDGEQYRDAKPIVANEIKEIFKSKSVNKLALLQKLNHPQAKFLAACFFDLFHYASSQLESIAESTSDIDLSLRWGFGWNKGPFEIWQGQGFEEILSLLKEKSLNKQLMSEHAPADWLNKTTAFYQETLSYSPSQNNFIKRSTLPVYDRQLTKVTPLHQITVLGETLFEDDSVRLWLHTDNIGVLNFKTKMSTISTAVLHGIHKALDVANNCLQGLVIAQADLANFSCGADLSEFVGHLAKEDKSHFKKMVEYFQETTTRIQQSPIPIVAAVSGRAFGGGCEIIQHCHHQVAALESYIGLVEVGVGLLPAGGGLKCLVVEAYKRAAGGDVFYFVEQAFKTVAMAKVSSSAVEAKTLGLLRPEADVILNESEVLFVAIAKAKQMAASNFTKPLPQMVEALGLNNFARLQMIIVNMQKGGFISEHDALIAEKIASVLCGGEVDEGELIDQSWLLKLEVDAFYQLGQTDKTKARIDHMLKTKRPLRN